MCGFAGLLSSAGFGRDELTDYATRMIGPIEHRGPDDSGTWADEHAGIALGFRRLSILDLSPQGHQPMRSPSGRFLVTFNGEIYNYLDLRRELEPHGHCFQGGSDTEVMLAAFEQWGIQQAVRRFAGMFAIAVWDAQQRALTLVRDRLGKKPLYVYREPGLITFASELKALFAGPSFDRSIDRAALASYLRYLCVPSPSTVFEHAIKLEPAHLVTVTDPGAPLPAPTSYWSLERVARDGLAHPFTGSDSEAVDALDELLAAAVRRRLRSDVPLGALLSGGVDSSTVVALMQEASSRPVKTYTIGFADASFDEADHAAQIAACLGTEHSALRLSGEDAHTLIPRLVDIFDEPFADPSQLPTLLVSQFARQDVTVALCGDGGDELFGGYNRYIYGSQILTRVNRIPRLMRQPVGAGLGSVPAPAWDRLRQLTASVLPVPHEHFGERVHKLSHLLNAESMAGMYRSLLSAWQEPDALLAADLLATVRGDADRTARIMDGASPPDVLDRMMLADQMMYLPDDLLAKVDRASMAVSLEVRAPLLDHQVVEWSWRLPRSMKVRGAVGKWILREVLYRRVPRRLIERPKMGFSVPIDSWLRGPLRNWARELLFSDDGRAGGWFDTAAVVRAWKDLCEGRPRAGTAVWAAVMLQAWRARWLN